MPKEIKVTKVYRPLNFKNNTQLKVQFSYFKIRFDQEIKIKTIKI